MKDEKPLYQDRLIVDAKSLRHRTAMAAGREECDLALHNAQVVDVFGRQILNNRTVLIGDGVVLALLEDSKDEVKAKEHFDCTGYFLVPGLMDAHLHIESTLLTPPSFAEAVLPCGTTRVVADPHEIANVCGKDGIRYMLEASKDLPVKIHIALPSCVPSSPFEDSGACLDAVSLEEFWAEERVCSLGEVMNYQAVLEGDEDLFLKIAKALGTGRMIDGHCPNLAGRSLQAYFAAGIGNDHEELDPKLIAEHVSLGRYVFVREGSAAKSLASILPAITSQNAGRFCFCTDDLHAEDILKTGHINAILAHAVALGLDAPTAVSMATINTAECFGFKHCGAAAPGYTADLVLLEDLKDFKPLRVWCSGVLAAKEGRALFDSRAVKTPLSVLHTVHLGDLNLDKLRINLPSKQAKIIKLLPHNLCTEAKIAGVVVDEKGNFDLKSNPGLCKIAVFERHKASGLVGLGILEGYAKAGKFLAGAVAVSIAHDSHNIVAAGGSDEDILCAVRAVAQEGGGAAVVQQGILQAAISLPVAGLMTDCHAQVTARDFGAVQQAARSLGVSNDIDPVMTLSFMSLCVIPQIRVNTRGLFDVDKFAFVKVDAGALQQGYRAYDSNSD